MAYRGRRVIARDAVGLGSVVALNPFRRMFSRLALVFLLGGFVCACGKEGPDNWEEGRPRIDRLQFLQQAPRNPFALQFSIEFTDTDGDLAAGQLHLFIADNESQSLDLVDLFSQQVPPIPNNATDGEMELLVTLSSSVNTGDQIKIGFILEDGQKKTSNEPYVVLQAGDS